MSSPTHQLPNFDALSDLFIKLGALGSPSELHGMLCGYLTAGTRWPLDEWLQQAARMLDIEPQQGHDSKTLLSQLYEATLAQLQDGMFDFSLVLPDESYSLDERAQSLGGWCYGYLNGFGLGGGSLTEKTSADVKESLEDFSRFSQLSEVQLDEQDADEADFTEVYEYVRVATVMIFMEFNAVQAEQTPPTIH